MKKLFSLLVITCFLLQLNVKSVTAQWAPAGPEGGIIKCSTASGDTIYALSGFYGSSMYVSYDLGDSWTNLNSPTLPTNVNTILKVGNSLFLGCGSTIPGSVGVYRSDDNGQTWTKKTNIESAIKGMTAQGAIIYAITSWNGIIRSLDNGDHWANVSGNLPDNHFTGGLAATPVAVYVSLDNGYGVWRSTSSGNTWESASAGIDEYATITTIAAVGNDLYAGTEASGIYKSSDEGTNWVNLDPGTTTNYWNYIAITGDATTLLAATYRDGILRSTNQGATWSINNTGVDIYDQPRTLISTDGAFFIGTKAGMYRTTDHGASWSETNSGIYAHMSPFVGIVSIDSILFTGSRYGGGIYRSSDNGNSWTNVSEGLPVNTEDLTNSFSGSSTAVFAFDKISEDFGNSWHSTNSPGTVGIHPFFSPWIEHNEGLFTINGQQGYYGIYRSLDNGQTWSTINNGINSDLGGYLSLNTDGSTLLLGTTNGAYYSTNNGDSWNLCTFPPELNFYPFAFKSYCASDNAKYCGFGGLYGLYGIYRSTDNCATWEKVNDNLGVEKMIVSGDNIYVSGTIKENINNQDVWVPYIYMSSNGINWNCITNNLGTDITPLSLAVDSNRIFIAKSSSPNYGIYFTNDNGVHWFEADNGVPGHTNVSSLTVLGNDLFAGTDANSLWKTSLDAFDTPSQPSAITGDIAPCTGSLQTYSVANVLGVTCNWLFPGDWIITDGAGTNSVSVLVGDIPGLIVVTPSTFAGNGPAQYLAVTPQSAVEPEITISSDLNNLCSGTAVSFEIEATGGGNNPEFEWYVNNIAVATGSNFSFIPLNGDYIKAEMLSDLPCAINNPAISNVVEMIVNQIPQTPNVIKTGDTLISDAPAGNQWYKDGAILEGEVNDTLKVMSYGSYYCIVTNNGCQSEPSNSITAAPLAIGKPDKISFAIYPVPSNGQFNLRINWPGNEQIRIQIFDNTGKLMFNTEIISSNGIINETLDLTPIRDGIYLVKLDSGSRSVVNKMLIISN